jgi:exopolysaccharide production protein ExoQ
MSLAGHPAPGGEPALITAWRAAPGFAFARPLEGAATVICLYLFSTALIGPVFADPADPESSAILRLIWLPVYALTLALCALRPGAILGTLANNVLLLGLVGLTAVSVIWSIDPDTTLRRSFALIMSTLFGFWMASRWSWRELILLIASAFGLIALSSTVMAVAVPSIGIDHAVHAGAWKGVFWEKNTLGGMMALGAVSAYAALRADPGRRWIWAGMAVLCTALVLLSTSKTALLSWTLGTGGAIGIMACRRGFGFATLILVFGATGAILLGMMLVFAPVEFLELLGRDATLTGRTDIWAILTEEVWKRPWTGYGYRAFWTVENGPVFWVRQGTSWPVPTAHNGLLEIALALGVPGVVLMLAVYLRSMIRAIGTIFSQRPETYWVLAQFAIMGLASISESNLMNQNSLSWILFTAGSAKLAQGSR